MEKRFLDLKVRNIMQKEDLPVAEMDDLIEDVLPFPMGRSHVWIVDDSENMEIVGVVTEHDILDILSPRRVTYHFGLPDMRQLEGGKVKDIMTRNVVKCNVEDTIREVLDKMTKHEVRRLPALGEEKKMVGEVHLKSITNKFAEVIKDRKS